MFDNQVINIQRVFKWMLGCYAAVHILYFFLPSLPFVSDAQSYYQWAEENVKSGTLYPSWANTALNKESVIAPVYINMLVVTLNFWNNLKAIFILNTVLNISQLVLVYLIARKLFDKMSAIIAGCLYMLYLNNLGLTLTNLTELAFGVFLLSSIYLYITGRKAISFIVSGFLLGLAIGVRPTGVVLAVAIVFITCWKILHNAWDVYRPLVFATGLLVYILTTGLYIQYSIGEFAFMSDSGPANLILSAHDGADGKYSDEIFKRKEFQIENHKERNRAYLQYATRWIYRHPLQWASQFPQKTYSTYIADDFAVSQLLLTNTWSLNHFIKDMRGAPSDRQFAAEPLWFRMVFLGVNIFHQLFYMFLSALFILYIIHRMKKKDVNKEEALLLLVIFLGTLMTLVGSIGSLRYKYTFLIIVIVLDSSYVARFVQKRTTIIV